MIFYVWDFKQQMNQFQNIFFRPKNQTGINVLMFDLLDYLRHLYILVFLLSFIVASVNAQSINTEFGKNRIQYHDDFSDWWQYETQNFITYWYGKSRNVAVHTLLLAEQDHNDLQKLLEHKINDKIEIIVYLDISDLKQSNIGTEETFVNKTGETKIIGNKMFVYFDGNHANLRKKIKEGIANVYLNHMLFGSNFQEIIQNALLMNIPAWYRTGIVNYSAQGWNMYIEDELRDVWNSDPKMRSFKKLSLEHPRLAGHSFWYFVEQNYGKSSISNILYLTKISRGIDNSFLYVLNEDLKSVQQEWSKFFIQYFDGENELFDVYSKENELSLKKRKEVPVSQLSYSPNGKYLAYNRNDRGKSRIYIKDLETGKHKKVFSHGFINDFQETDYNYPLFSWFPNDDILVICYEHRDVIKLKKIDIKKNTKEEQIIPEAIQRIYSMAVVDKNEFVFSASTNGFSDLIRYKYKTRNVENLTKDYFDDLDVTLGELNGKNGLLFSSNRAGKDETLPKMDTIIPQKVFNVYFYSFEDTINKIVKLTDKLFTNARFPQVYDENSFLFMSEESGMVNIKKKNVDSNQESFLTNIDRNIIRYTYSKQLNNLTSTFYHSGSYTVKNQKVQTGFSVKPDPTPLTLRLNGGGLMVQQMENEQEKVVVEIPEEYLFQSKFESQSKDRRSIEKEEKQITVSKQNILQGNKTPDQQITKTSFNPARITTANKRFSLHKVTTKFDNDILFEGLESYTGDRQQLLGTPMGFLMKANIKDLFEDYSIDIGTRLPLLLNGSEFFIVFDNKKKLIDRRMALYRKSQSYSNPENNQPGSLAPTRSVKVSTLGLYQWKIPFNIYKSFRITSQLRFDRFYEKSTENVSLNEPFTTEQRVSLRGEYIFDNSHDESVNIKFGTRYKVYVEAINTFNVKLIDGFEFDASKGFATIIGFDARHYIPVLKHSVLALRAAGASSFGSNRMLYYLGGMENWLFPSFDNTIPQRTDIDFAYKANIGQLRGFNNNIRNGTTYVLGNVELRIPFVQYILGKNKGSSFFRNMQITGFFDVGTAWYGSSPYSKLNPLNSVTVESPPIIRLEVEYFKDPAVFGLGYGFRTQLFGYFVKFDHAWGIETGKFQRPLYYLTLGQDF